MTDHNKKELSITLLNNSRITGVLIGKLSPKLATTGHGLFIESLGGDRYIDLRFSSKRPFWGHSHPLEIQNSFRMLKEDLSGDKIWSTVERNEVQASLKKMATCSLNLEELDQNNIENKKTLLVTIDEGFVSLSKEMRSDILTVLGEISIKRALCIFEKNLALLSEESIAYTANINSQKILKYSCSDLYLTQGLNHNLYNTDPFIDAMLDFTQSILIPTSGKFASDRKIMNDFLFENNLQQKVERFGHYLIFKTSIELSSDFLEFGLLIDQEQLSKGRCVLSIPCSCTKNELLDTLARVKNTVSR